MKPDFNLAYQVKGFLEEEEGMRLFEIAEEACKLGPCLEIGSYCGKSTIYLGEACKKKNSILFSIDHHRGSEEQQPGEEYFDPELLDPKSGRIDTFAEFRKTIEMAELENTVVPMVCPSNIAAHSWSTPLSLVFIDGGHAYETVLSDYTQWARHVVHNGFLLFHDIFTDPNDGGQAPYQVYQMAIKTGIFQKRPMTRTLGVLQKF